MPQVDDSMVHPNPLTFWIERCPVCSVSLSGWSCLARAGYRGFFVCPNCESALELRGRSWVFILMFLAVIVTTVFLWWFLYYFPAHRMVTLFVGFGSVVAFLVFMWVISAKFLLSIGRKDVDATFVL